MNSTVEKPEDGLRNLTWQERAIVAARRLKAIGLLREPVQHDIVEMIQGNGKPVCMICLDGLQEPLQELLALSVVMKEFNEAGILLRVLREAGFRVEFNPVNLVE